LRLVGHGPLLMEQHQPFQQEQEQQVFFFIMLLIPQKLSHHQC